MTDANAGQSMAGTEVRDRSIGAIIAETRDLSADQVDRVLAYQRDHNVRFGEAAIALGYANADDVLFALAQQFHYPYAPEESRHQNPELIALNQPFSPQAEVFRAVRSQVMMRVFNEPDAPRRAVAVVSPNQGDGKTFFAANLAVALAQLGGRTLLVDADMRGPRQHEVFGVPNTHGLSGILSGRAEGQLIQQVTAVPGLFLLPVGITPPNPLELIERPAFGLLLRELLVKFDYVIVDTPAAELGADSLVIAARCGAALPVARKSESKLDMFQELVQGLTDASTKIAGAVLNEY
ncbi:polysaccharide biosynthesis tyrosine autokinase [Roseateles sp.]|uniref:polysaccharide biosynthesis tyrosine autokinase n=1 Tax=Roseateles sp. TaxID=1971397 RepID=UPI0025CC399C|nr:polysaccharide biosynthesis tyrosine autokinase [Roseateles sp.]MBV8033889.1 polysaccharide biosynthesis tyrosine autokinase [Roseateles sp.]